MATEAVQQLADIPVPQVEAAEDNTAILEDTPTSLSKDSEPGKESDAVLAEASDSCVAESSGNSLAGAGSENKSNVDGKAAVAKTKKKEDKSIEYILKALSSLNSPEEKLAALCKKYADLHEEHRVLQTSFKQQQRKMAVVQRERDQLQGEHTKAVFAKSKLESLCRELQKQNKAVKEESVLRQKEEEEIRKDISNKFQTTIKDIQAQMTENHEKNVKLREENQDLAGKLKRFLEQNDLREEQLEKIKKQRDLESQLVEAKLQQTEAIISEVHERHSKEKEVLMVKNAEAVHMTQVMETQLNMYKDRYEEFQGTINKSNDMFQKLKSEMDKMGKRIKKLEKEGAQWKAKWETSNKTVLDMAEEKCRTDKEKQVLQTKVVKLESLCRALQGEMHGKKSSSPLPSSSSSDDHSKMAANKDSTEKPMAAAPVPTTSTPPNTPEENTSRASPNPESQLPTGQNGPTTATASVPALSPSGTCVESSSEEPQPSEQEQQDPQSSFTSDQQEACESSSSDTANCPDHDQAV